MYVFAESNYCILVERKRRITVKYSLPQILPLLPAREFIQVHRNYIVRIDEIESISLSHNELHVFGQVVPVSRQKFREDLLKRVKAQK
jgi:DNA-binding LytR/AlgR family response regulator